MADKVLPLEVYGALPEVSMMVISPSGDKVAYRRTGNGKDFMMVHSLVENKLISAVDMSNIQPSQIYFIDEQRLILVIRRHHRLVGYRGRHDISSAYSYNIKKKKLVQLLTLGNGIYSGQTQLGNIVGLSSDGKYAYMQAWANENSFSLMKARLGHKKKARQFKRGSRDTIDYFVDANDQVLAREAYDNKKDLHRVEAQINGKWREIFSEKTSYRTKAFVGVTADSNYLVMLDKNSDTGHSSYYTMRLKDGKISNPIFSKQNKSVEAVLTDINRVVYGVRYSGFKPSYELFNKKVNEKVNTLIQSMPNNSLTLVDHTPDWNKIIFLKEGDSTEGDYLIYADNKFTALASQRPKISAEQVHQIHETEYKARDGLKIPLLLTLPHAELSSLPAILMPHGGPESYDKIGFDWMAQYFASRGFIVIQPQFRGSDGFGSDFILKGRGEWGRKMQHDLTDAVKILVKSGYVDPKRVCIVGASYGGYAALAGATFTPKQYKCAVSINGVADIGRMLKDEVRNYGSDHWVVSYWQESIGKGILAEDYFEKISPIHHVNNVEVPILLIHGENDEVVPVSQSENMYEKLNASDKQVKFLELEDGDHYLSNGSNRMKVLEAIDKFIMKHI
ncbi:MAG: S9 family peptidase [Colwellia sp.]|nr:S9 family peptidase [Colwellia sp.]